MALYTETVMDHFMHPRNVGEIAEPDGVGQVGNAKCGDIMKMYLKIKDNIIQDVKFETFGCGSAIASSSMATELIKGKTIEDIRRKWDFMPIFSEQANKHEADVTEVTHVERVDDESYTDLTNEFFK